REREFDFLNNDSTVVILGAGHTGLEIATQFKYPGVQTFAIDKKPRGGDMVSHVVYRCAWREGTGFRFHNYGLVDT
ncbi:hypothetical protein HD554DRAFT_2015618, partial [Boletus coccyginus]